jgi:murein DD-endopeptidase MepM/ murein hydrolase activator NlpD
VLTQAFGANPAIYRRYGMPGHEGVDLRAPTNATSTCADGRTGLRRIHQPQRPCLRIHIRHPTHRRIQDGLRPSGQTLVAIGDPVHAGQLIGRAVDGNSSAAHYA